MVQPQDGAQVRNKPPRKARGGDRDAKTDNERCRVISPASKNRKRMKKYKAHIECNKDGFYSVYVEEGLPFGVIGEGKTVEAAKSDFLAVYEAMRQDYREETGEDVLAEFCFVTEISALLQQYKGMLTLSGLSQITGVNKGQLSQYLCGRRNPSLKTQEQIKQAVQAFAQELSQAFA